MNIEKKAEAGEKSKGKKTQPKGNSQKKSAASQKKETKGKAEAKSPKTKTQSQPPPSPSTPGKISQIDFLENAGPLEVVIDGKKFQAQPNAFKTDKNTFGWALTGQTISLQNLDTQISLQLIVKK